MPIDASIPLGVKTPDTMQSLSSLLGAANSAQQFQNNNISLNERKAVSQVLSDPSSYTDQDGNIDFNRAAPQIMRVAPTTGMKYIQDMMTAQQQQVAAKQSLNNLTTDVRAQAGKVFYGMDPNTPPDVFHKTVATLRSQYKGGDAFWNMLDQGYDHAVSIGKGPDFIANAAKTTLPQDTQQAMNTPNTVTVNNGAEQIGFNTKPGVQGYAQGAPVFTAKNQIGPGGLESVQSDAQNNQFIVSRTPDGAIVGTRPLQSATPGSPGPFRLPPNETQQTLQDLQTERTAAKTAATTAPVLHDINRTIVQEANKGFNTGTLGALTQKITSATGYQFDPSDKSTDYNILGKYLERSALTAAQSMGPHTNAGLEAAVRANGSLDYTPQALKKISYLNDALVTGSEMYQHGLERAISGSPNGVFAKRQFDQDWGKVATPQALRLKNAVDQGNQEEIQNLIKEVGGKGTAKANALYAQIKRIRELSGD